uniref:Uncharacterized protein n=1 Tax=Arundo donax TaxID=35708 RepID=A0A0A8YKY9_ARUDO
MLNPHMRHQLAQCYVDHSGYGPPFSI